MVPFLIASVAWVPTVEAELAVTIAYAFFWTKPSKQVTALAASPVCVSQISTVKPSASRFVWIVVFKSLW